MCLSTISPKLRRKPIDVYKRQAYKQNYRSVDNFLKADCLPMDCDNDHSDDPDDWLTPFDVAMDFPGVGMIFVYSRSHMKQKGKRGPRPRFHVDVYKRQVIKTALRVKMPHR